MRVVDLNPGATVFDSLQFSQGGTPAYALALSRFAKAVALYLGVATKKQAQAVLDAGMGILPVTLASEYKDGGTDEVAQLRNLGIPQGVTVFADMEGLSTFNAKPQTVMDALDAWAKTITDAGYTAGLYVGVPQPLTSRELYMRPLIKRYWRGQGSIRDRYNGLAEPDCGWCMTQAYPSQTVAGVLVDFNQVTQDYRGRVPSVVVA